MKESLLVAVELPRSLHLPLEGGILLETPVTRDSEVFLALTWVLFEFAIPLGIACSFLGVMSVPERAANTLSLQSGATRSSRLPCPNLCVVFV